MSYSVVCSNSPSTKVYLISQ